MCLNYKTSEVIREPYEVLVVNKFTFVRSEVFTAVTMKNAVFWDVESCNFCRRDVSEERITSIIRATRIGEFSQEPHGVTPQKTPFF
jgi:hypothetical protein